MWVARVGRIPYRRHRRRPYPTDQMARAAVWEFDWTSLEGEEVLEVLLANPVL
jgi:hypothetical protein